MKAELKKTGEIINIASCDRVKLDKYDSNGCSVEVAYEEVKQFYDEDGVPLGLPLVFQSVPKSESKIDWEQVRIQATIAAMQGLCANSNLGDNKDYRIAKWAIAQADALIIELKKGNKNESKS